jgi:hypothetical protein
MAHMRIALLLLAMVALSGCDPMATRTVVVTATPAPASPSLATPAPSFAIPTAASIGGAPSNLTLTLNDVGGSYIETVAASHSNAQVAATYHLSAAALRRRGRLSSYETQFSRQQPTGILQIDDVVAAWRSPAGARWDMRRVVSQLLGSKPVPKGIQSIDALGLGDTRRAITFRGGNQASNLIDYALVFQRGRYRAYVQVVGVTGTVADADVLHLARIVDRRIEQVAS